MRRLLIPRVALGAQELRTLPSVSIDIGSESSREERDPVASLAQEAYRSPSVMTRGNAVVYLGGCFGPDGALGVLVLSISREFYEPRQAMVMVCLETLRVALSDILKL